MIVNAINFEQIISKLSEGGEYGLDTETYGLKFQDGPFAIIISDAKEEYYFNLNTQPDHLGSYPKPVLELYQVEALNKLVFMNPHSRWYIHNAKFDLQKLRLRGIQIEGEVWCTMAIARVLKNNEMIYSLEACAKRARLSPKSDEVKAYIKKHKLWEWETIPGKKKRFKNERYWQVPLDVMHRYGCQDARLHYELGQRQKNELNQLVKLKGYPEIEQVAKNEITLTKVCHEMEWQGVKVDLEYIEAARRLEESSAATAKTEFIEMTGHSFKDSPKALAAAFDAIGESYPRTEKGNPSFAKEALEEMTTPAAEQIKQIRHHEKMAGTYYSSFQYYSYKGELHPNMRQGGTETGRFSYSDPNLQNVPKQEELGEDFYVRKSFVPREDYCFVMIDYDQQEFRMLLDYAGEHKLIEEVLAGKDVHQATADLMGVDRKTAKMLNFMLLYGGGAAKLAKALEISLDQAKALKEKYFAAMPRVKQLIRAVMRRGENRGYIMNWFGRRCHLKDPDFAYVLPNHLIQGGGADVIKKAMVEIDKFLKDTDADSQMVLQVHDEILFEIHKDELNLVPSLKTMMENIYEAFNGMKLECSVEHSWVSWGTPDRVKGLPGGRPNAKAAGNEV